MGGFDSDLFGRKTWLDHLSVAASLPSGQNVQTTSQQVCVCDETARTPETAESS
jgi:hypothetical protein